MQKERGCNSSGANNDRRAKREGGGKGMNGDTLNVAACDRGMMQR